jgi:formylmethanofuran dehydrogenase subunit E
MKTRVALVFSILVLTSLFVPRTRVNAHEEEEETGHIVQSEPGENPWNRGRPPEDWWAACEQMHGHVGPWNVLGWRIGQAALREFETEWGRHELDIVCHLPLSTPYSCLADGVVIGTGNSLGRLDIRLAETLTPKQISVSVRRKDGTSEVLIFHPDPEYLQTITDRPVEKLEALSRECRDMDEADLFRIERLKR